MCIAEKDTNKRFFLTSLLYGFIFLTRPDTVFLITPTSMMMFLYAYKEKGITAFKVAAIAIIPVLVWEMFSLVYYGTFVPNTAIAKTSIGYSRTAMLARGWDYLKTNIYFDPITLGTVIFAFFIAIFTKKHIVRLLMCGVALQLTYICYVGADYMIGRFLTTSLLVSVIAIVFSGSKIAIINHRVFCKHYICYVFVIISVLLYIIPIRFTANIRYLPNFSREHQAASNKYSKYKVTEERSYYYPDFGMIPVINNHHWNPYTHKWFSYGVSKKIQKWHCLEPPELYLGQHETIFILLMSWHSLNHFWLGFLRVLGEDLGIIRGVFQKVFSKRLRQEI